MEKQTTIAEIKANRDVPVQKYTMIMSLNEELNNLAKNEDELRQRMERFM